MTNLRKIIDITPWDKSGHSFWGLNREQSKKLAMCFIVVGGLLALPPFIPDPTDILSIVLANFISERFAVGFTEALLSTYFIGIFLLIVGCWIYPYNSHSLFNGYITKFKRTIRKAMRDPKYIIIAVILIVVLYNWYAGQM